MYDQDVNDDDDRSESIEITLAGQKDQHYYITTTIHVMMIIIIDRNWNS